MPLSARDRGRYARHLLLPEIGLAGQERLVATRWRFAPGASAEASAVAKTYLERAGMTVESASESDQGEIVVAVGTEQAIEGLAGTPDLVHAAAALAGALAAVEAVKKALGLGTAVGDPQQRVCLSGVEARASAREPHVQARDAVRAPNSEDV